MTHRAFLTSLFLLVLIVTGPLQARPEIAPNSYIVQVSHMDDVGEVAARVMRTTRGRVAHVYTKALWGFSIQVPRGIGKSAILRNAGVLTVEEDLVMRATGQILPTGVNRMDAEGAVGPVDVDIAIIDTGIDQDHPDLTVAGGIRYYTVIGGRRGGTFEDEDYDDDNGHGTHVAGTAAAIDNDSGVVGVAPGARLWAVKVLDSSGRGYLSAIIAGIDWVTGLKDSDGSQTIEVANMSLGGQGSNDAYRTAIRNSVAAGVVYVVAAGNDTLDVYGPDGTFGTDDDIIPAAYPEVAAIAALSDTDGLPGGYGPLSSYGSDDRNYDGYPDGWDDSFAHFSNYSRSVVADNPVDSPGAAIDLILPGVDITSTYMGGGLATASGTSMASPHAAGLVALYIAANGRASNAQEVYDIRQALIDTGMAQSSGNRLAHPATEPDTNPENLGWVGGSGHLPPIANAGPDQILSDADSDGQVDVTLDGSSSYDPDGSIVGYAWYIDEGVDPVAYTATATLSLSPGAYTARLEVIDNDGLSGQDSVSITVNDNLPPVAEAGMDQTVVDDDGDDHAEVALNGSASHDPDGDIASYAWYIDDDTVPAAETAATTVSLPLGVHTARLEVTDNGGSTDSDSILITVQATPTTTMHVGDLDARKQTIGRGTRWLAYITVTVHDSDHSPVPNATVYAEWSGIIPAGSVSGTTGSDGTVTFGSGRINSSGTVTFTVTGVTGALDYEPSQNHDPDGDGDGTSISITN